MSKLMEDICFQCDEVGELLKGQTTCIHCDSLNRKNDYEQQLCDGLSTNITKDNIHLYYEFMNNEDLNKHHQMIDEILDDRTSFIYDHFKIDSLEREDEVTICDIAFNSHFGVKDTLKPIDEYVSEIKQSEQYKTYMANK